MADVKVLHMADMHLASAFAAMGADGHRGNRRREELKEIFAGIINLAAASGVQVMLIAGDLFEHATATRGLIKYIDQQFRRIPEIRIFISPGNHDPFLAGSYYALYPWAPNVKVFSPSVGCVDLPDLPVSVYGWGFGSWEVTAYQLSELVIDDPSRINLLVAHGGDAAYHPLPPAELAKIGADYIALGHIHKESVVRRVDGQVVARYSGSPEALNFGEPGEHGVLLGTVSKGGSRMDFVPTGRRRYLSVDVDASGAVSVEDLLELIRGVDSPERRADHCYRVTLSGGVDPELMPDLQLLEERLAPEFYFLKLVDGTHADYDLEELAAERSARGLFVQRLLTMEAAESDPNGKARIRRALALGLRALSGKGAPR